MSRVIYVINGPNLNLLGTRQPEVYGRETLADVERDCRALAKTLDLEVAFHQSNFEGGVIDFIHDARLKAAGVIINAGAYTHTSVALLDAILAAGLPVIEVHLSNLYKREPFRHHSYIARAAVGQICGFGADSYFLGLRAALGVIKKS